MDRSIAIKSYHWPFLAQPAPLPETLIAGAPEFYADRTLASWTKTRDLSCFDMAALASYRGNFADAERIHAMCEDYRAGATIDRDLDEADLEAGRKIGAPLLCLWGSDYVGRGSDSPLGIWQRFADRVEGSAIDAGHFLAEENPDETLKQLLPFLKRVVSS